MSRVSDDFIRAPQDVTDDSGISRAVVFLGFAELITRFQMLELSFWSILVTQQERDPLLDEHIAKLERWDEQPLRRLVHGVVGMPPDLRVEADLAVATQNYLVRRWMRERAMFLDDADVTERIVDELIDISDRLDDFEERLDQFKRDLGVQDLTDADLEELGCEQPPTLQAWAGKFGPRSN